MGALKNNFSAGQQKNLRQTSDNFARYINTQRGKDAARSFVLVLAERNGAFECPADLVEVSGRAGWGVYIGRASTDRVHRDFVQPLEAEGLLAKKTDERGRIIGYVITEAGILFLDSLPGQINENP